MGTSDKIQVFVCSHCLQDNSFKFFVYINCILKIANVVLVQAYLEDIVGSLPDHHNKANIMIT